MPTISKKHRALAVASVVIAIPLLAWLAWPAPVPVDLATVSRTSMEVTVDDDARTRIHRIYTVSAPLTGTVLKPALEVGDSVTANETVVAVMKPMAPSFHDPRLHQELQSALSAATAGVALADAERRRIEAALNYSRVELSRIRALAGQGIIARSALDKAVADVQANDAALASANAELQVRRNERDSAATRVQNPIGTAGTSSDPGCCVQIRAPITGQVLKLINESEAVVQAGTPLIEIGNPQDLEIVAELLSTDAVQVRHGQAVHIDGWGGESIEGRVKRIEPAGFMKVSALGIEEQRVRAIVDFTDPPSRWRNLGHDYRVVVHVVTWEGTSVLTVPIGALFRANDKWAVFRNDAGRARVAEIVIGYRNNRVAEVLSGLSERDQVVVHAGDRVNDGTRIAQRE
jgi:HlyD family secretion protein